MHKTGELIGSTLPTSTILLSLVIWLRCKCVDTLVIWF